MTYDPDNHATYREMIAVALAGGLSADEQSAFDAHRAGCAECAAAYERAKESEDRMTALFAPALPAAGFEDRVIHRLREMASPRRRFRLPHPIRLHPAIAKAAAGVAAAIVLAGVGYAVNGMLQESSPAKMASNVRQIGQAIQLYGQDGNGSYSYQNPYPGAQSTGAGFKLNNSVGAEYAVAADLKPSDSSGKDEDGDRTAKLYNDGHVTWEVNPFVGVNRDNFARGVVLGDAVAGRPVTEGRAGGAGGGGDGGGGNARFGLPQQQGQQQGQSSPGAAPVVDAPAKPAESYWFKPTQLATVVDAEKGVSAGAFDAGDATLTPTDGETRAVPTLSEDLAAAQRGEQPVDSRGRPEVVRAGVMVAQAPAQPPNAPPPPPPAPQTEAPTTRRIIRNGEMAFEVERFDSALAQVSKLTGEAGGYVGTTSSEKLPNGKVQGKVTVRVPPDRLDTLVLQLRGIGELKSQSLEAQDVSKKYTDLESQLRAARAMEERLLAIIKEGKGQIKDLLAAEKELGVWRTKVEEYVGEMKYYDNLVSMATLQLTLTEKNIETPATAYETENVDAGVETEDVEKARAEALKAIEEAKGRVVQSDLKRFDAGQFGATIVAEVPPDAAGPLLDRLKQIGKMARLDVQRKQSASENKSSSSASRAPVRVEKRDTRFNLSIYNLANVAPRQTVSLNLAADDVEKAYQAIIDRVAKAGGRIVSSNLNRQKPEQTTGTISFEVPTAQAEAVTGDLRAAGEAMRLTVTENPDVQNVTTAKRGFSLSIVSTATVAAREAATIQLAATDVAEARQKILQAAGGAGVRALSSQLNENDRQNVTAALDLDVKRGDALAAVEKAIADAGQVVSRSVQRSADAENTLDTKVRLSLSLAPADKLAPRETTTLTVEASDFESAMASLQSAAVETGGRVAQSNLSKDRDGRGAAKLTVEVPLEKGAEMVRRARELGAVRDIDAAKNLQVPAGPLSRARVDVTFTNAEALVAPERGLLASIRSGLATSVAGLMWSLQLIVIGLCFVLPWALVLYGAWRLLKRRGAREAAAAAPSP